MEFVVFTLGALAYWNLADYLEASSRDQRELLRKAVILDEDAWANLSEF